MKWNDALPEAGVSQPIEVSLKSMTRHDATRRNAIQKCSKYEGEFCNSMSFRALTPDLFKIVYQSILVSIETEERSFLRPLRSHFEIFCMHLERAFRCVKIGENRQAQSQHWKKAYYRTSIFKAKQDTLKRRANNRPALERTEHWFLRREDMLR